MSKTVSWLFLFITFVAAHTSTAQETVTIPKPESVLSTLRTPHPRLLVQKGDPEKFKSLRISDKTFDNYAGDVLKNADEICTKPVLSYKVREGYRLMSVSRECIGRAGRKLCRRTFRGQQLRRVRGSVDGATIVIGVLPRPALSPLQ